MMAKKTNYFSAELEDLKSAVAGVVEGFGLVQEQVNSSVYGLEVLFKNDFAGVVFEFSPREGAGWGAFVGRLVDGELPENPIRLDEGVTINRFDIRDVASVRLGFVNGLTEKIVHDMALSAADVCLIIEKCCGDLFRGDGFIFNLLQEVVIKRWRLLSRLESK
jgi:hypothetical protein